MAEDLCLIAHQAGNMPDEEAKELEDFIEAHPEDLIALSKLLGHYFLRWYQNKAAVQDQSRHALWVIQHHPESAIAGSPYCTLDPHIHGDSYFEAKKT